MTLHDDDAATWRDLADQLTAEQIVGLEGCERRFNTDGVADDPRAQASLLGFARQYAEHNLVDAAYADVPLPAGASTNSEGWGKDLKQGGYRRSLLWRNDGQPGGVSVDIDGWQWLDGSFARHISLWGVDEGGALSCAQARSIAAMLLDAADELDERLQK
jgi:hypothetical protein